MKYTIAKKSHTPGLEKDDEEFEYRYHPIPAMVGKYDLEKFVQHVATHNSIFTEAEVRGVLTKAVACIRELLLAGYSVCLDSMGTFYYVVTCKPAATASALNAKNITAVRVHWRPSKKFDDMKADCTFELVETTKSRKASLAAAKLQATVR